MKFLANENFPILSFRILKEGGWDIEHVCEINSGITDEEVMEFAINEDRIIITFDRDYGELIYKYDFKPPGVIYLRVVDFTPEYPSQLLIETLVEDKLEVYNLFTVIDNNQIRQRKI